MPVKGGVDLTDFGTKGVANVYGKSDINNSLWWTDWDIQDGVVAVKSTGQRLPFGRRFMMICANWLVYYICMEAWRAASLARKGPKVAFIPHRPRPWYFIWPALHAAGGRIVNRVEDADLVVCFEDATCSTLPAKPGGVPTLNFDCNDVSKTRVASVFESVFGYPLHVDPATHHGTMVEKSEINGAHDGQIITGPSEARPGFVYQRVVDNRLGDDIVEDYRCLVVGASIPLGFIKRRPVGRRFTNANTEVLLEEPESYLTPEETASLVEFARQMGLEWGALDVLRDRADGRIYVVDVNKTNIDPPIALPLKQKFKATRRIAAMLREMSGLDPAQ